MSRRNDAIRVRHMLDHAREALALVRGQTRAVLDADRVLELAVVRLLEIVGEAAGRVSEDFRSAHPEVAWAQIVSLRNRLIHGYDAVDKDILWQILQEDLPALVMGLEHLGPSAEEQ